mmetsp:Transcript_17864/g.30806  ORF Transcript_17864/g.30806 Transcript_17864/m.30806 type:complete len:226 (+) Transcript_17864:582-1259(+)
MGICLRLCSSHLHLACSIGLGCIYWGVRKTENRTQKYRHNAPSSRNNAHSQQREVASQALLYSVAYAIPWIWGLVLSFINTGNGVFNSSGVDDAVTALNIANAVIFPLQGFLNAFVYVRPRYKQEKKKHPETTLLQMALRTFFSDADVEFNLYLPSRRNQLKATRMLVSKSPKPDEEKTLEVGSNTISGSKPKLSIEQDPTGIDKSPEEDAQSLESIDLPPEVNV